MNKTIKNQRRGVIPSLRFPPFKDSPEWEISTLNELANRKTDRNRDEKIDRVLTNSAERGVIDQRDYFDKDIAVKGKLASYYIVDKGDFVYNPRISTLAPVGPISRNNISKGVMSPLYTVFRFKQDNSDFYAHYFKSSAWHTYMRRVSSTGARHDRMAINNNDFMAMPLPVPSYEEQQEIVGCLSSLEELISAQVEKIDNLKAYKKGLMKQLFPGEGAVVPELRFPEFCDRGEWEETTFGKVATFFNGRAYKQSELLDSGKYRVLRVGNFFSNTSWYYSDMELEENKYCENGDLLYAWSASFGPRIWDGEKVIYHYHIWKVIENQGVSRNFLFVLLDYETDRMKSQSANGLGMMHITKGVIENWRCFFPSIDEQEKIAECILSLNSYITANSEKLDALKAHRKGLIQQLFPHLETVGK